MTKTILSVDQLNKKFQRVHAVKDISFALEEGDVFAFLGPNGAGKTTILRILLDIIRADSGRVTWNLNGTNSTLPEPSLLGYLPEERGLYLDLPVLRTLIYLASIRGMKPANARSAAMQWLERLDLAKRANDKLQTLSKGNQQKVQFIASVIHKPRFAILDEPFSGLDPLNQELFIKFIRELNQQGSTILLSSHQMQLVEKIAGKVFLINQGQQVFYGSMKDIYQDHNQQQTFHIRFSNAITANPLDKVEGIVNVENIDPHQLKVTFAEGMDIQKIMAALSRVENIIQLKSHHSNLHDIFLSMLNMKKQ